MNVSLIVQYVSYLLISIGVMAFIVSVITQVIKSLPRLVNLPTSAVVIVLSLVLCPVSFLALMAWMQQIVTWYMTFACFIVSFIIALVAMGGWEKVSDIWDRTKYKEKK